MKPNHTLPGGLHPGALIVFATLASIALAGCASGPATGHQGEPRFGRLAVRDGVLVGGDGEPVQLRGVSTMGLQWYGGVVNARGLYVIIDWHVLTPGDPNDAVYAGADAFFDEMSRRYAGVPNVIYEIMNEPNGPVTWTRDLKPYAQRMVSVIRANDAEAIILVGSGTWSQDVDLAAADPIDGSNIMYTFHFYAGTHGESLRRKVRAAIARGAAVFCSEWGTSTSSGDGGPFFAQSDAWVAFMDENRISWVAWSLSPKRETSALLAASPPVPLAPRAIASDGTPPGTPAGTPYWPQDELSPSGVFIRDLLRNPPGGNE